jgi:hypothetical protein
MVCVGFSKMSDYFTNLSLGIGIVASLGCFVAAWAIGREYFYDGGGHWNPGYTGDTAALGFAIFATFIGIVILLVTLGIYFQW